MSERDKILNPVEKAAVEAVPELKIEEEKKQEERKKRWLAPRYTGLGLILAGVSGGLLAFIISGTLIVATAMLAEARRPKELTSAEAELIYRLSRESGSRLRADEVEKLRRLLDKQGLR